MPVNPRGLLASRARRKVAPQSIPAPTLGWNTRDPFEAMEPEDAIVLDNWYPDFQGCLIRGGSTDYATKIGGGGNPVRTISAFREGSLNKFLAATNGNIYDITDPASVVMLGSAFGSDIWGVPCTFNSRQFWVNGIDQCQVYDGTTLAPDTFTGASTATFTGVGAFHNRLFFWTGVDAAFWYGEVNGIAGVLAKFDLATVSQLGGNLIAIETLSYDGGEGIQSYTCFFMSSGEILLYQGTDPSNANNWALVGRYPTASPVAMRSVTRYGGDIYITTASDHQQLSKFLIALKLGQTPPRTKASGAVAAAYQYGSGLLGWQALYYPAGARIIYNIPNPDGTFDQHVFNTSTQAWCRYRGLNAYCWGLFNGKVYYGAADGAVIQAEVGTSDNGAEIVADGQSAWQLFDTPTMKRVTAVRPVAQSTGLAMFTFRLGYDYQGSSFSIPGQVIPTGNSLVWGSGNWGPPYQWGGSGVTDPRWMIAGGSGAAIGLRLSADTQLGAAWVRTDLMIEPGSQF